MATSSMNPVKIRSRRRSGDSRAHTRRLVRSSRCVRATFSRSLECTSTQG
jgi:hypothetical protein